jgi:hypothetical protein
MSGKQNAGQDHMSNIKIANRSFENVVHGEAVYDVLPKNNVPADKWNTNKNCIRCLNLGREVERLHQELSLANETIKLLNNDIDLIQRHTNVSTIHDHTNTDRHHQNGNIRSNE